MSVIERETYSAIGTTTGTRLPAFLLVWGRDWLDVSECREPGRRQGVDRGPAHTAMLGVTSAQERYRVLN